MAEKARGVTVSIFGMILGVIELLLAIFIIYVAINISILIAQVMSSFGYYAPPAYLVGLMDAAGVLILLGGIYVLVHSIKRIIDQLFMAYISLRQ
jgi:cytochrome c-type biogenesis protein CcmE